MSHRELLEGLAAFLRERSTDVSYGFYCTEDPRDFTPDPECCTADEIEAHRKACEDFAAGKTVDTTGHRRSIRTEDSVTTISPPSGGYGLGTSILRDREMETWLEKIEAALRDGAR